MKELYEYQLKNVSGTDYQKYIKYLHLFFQRPHKKDKYDKEYLNGQYILIDKSKPSHKIMITPAKFVNMHQYYLEMKHNVDVIAHKISYMIESKENFTKENRDDFEILKERYLSSKKKMNDIEWIDENFYKEMEKMNETKLEKTNDILIQYKKKNDIYGKIKTMIPESVKSQWMVIYKKNKMSIPKTAEINQLGKENNIPSDDVELWFQWIEACYYYLLLNKEICDLNRKIEERELSYDLNTKYLIIKKPIVQE